MDTIIALYDNVSHAQQAAERLVGQGIEPHRITLVLQKVSEIYRAAAGDDDMTGEPLKQGGALVAVQLEEEESSRINDTLEQYGYVDAVTLQNDEVQQAIRAAAPHVAAGDFWIDVEAAFQRHFHANYEAKGYEFEVYEPAYRFGFAMANDTGWIAQAEDEKRAWKEALLQLREAWKSHYRGEWQQFSEAIRHGWQVAQGRRPGLEPDVTEVQTTKRGAQYRELSEEQ
ncbi:MAG: hypothetical protein ACOC8X_00825 [Chloroflexota bacterium]